MAGVMEVTLERDGHDQPWGFRLQGGHDIGHPLSVQRILVGTPADGILRKDDIILKIGTRETKSISHHQAADLFTKTGNQIKIVIKRGAKVSFSDSAPHTLSGYGDFTANNLLNALPKTILKDSTRTDPSLPLTIKNQPYRTNPLIQPSVKTLSDMEPGSAVHLKRQANYIAAAQGPLSIPINAHEEEALPEEHQNPHPLHQSRSDQFVMQQKVTGTLQNVYQQSQSSSFTSNQSSASSSSFSTTSTLPKPDQITFKPPSEKTVTFAEPPEKMHHRAPALANAPTGAGKQFYNSPIKLYSSENVAEVAKMNEMGMVPVAVAPSAMPLNPQKSQQVVFNPPKDYNPQESATWRALQESSGGEIDFEKAAKFTSLKEHDPVYSDIYQVPKNPQVSPRRQAPNHDPSQELNDGSCSTPNNLQSQSFPPNKGRRAPRSPVADLLPPSMKASLPQDPEETFPQGNQDQIQSAVMSSVMANGFANGPPPNTLRDIPMFEHDYWDEADSPQPAFRIPGRKTNTIGGRKRITQSASFNKVMMDVLGE